MVSTNTSTSCTGRMLILLQQHFGLWVGIWISFIRSCCMLDVFMLANLSECMDCGGLELFRTRKATAYAV